MTTQQVLSVSNAVGARFNAFSGPNGPTQQASAGSGLAAGTDSRWAAWANGGNTTSTYNANRTDGPASHSSDIMSGVLGADYRIAQNLVAGMSLAFDNGETAQVRNSMSSNITTSGYAVAPYVGYQINQAMTLDATAGWGQGKMNQDQTSYATSDRTFYAANLGYTQWFGNWQVASKAGYLHSEEKYGQADIGGAKIADSAHKSKLSQARLGAQVGYWSNGVMPYLGLTYTNDVERTKAANTPWDRDAVMATVGVNFISLKDGVSAGFTYNNELCRSYSHNHSLMGNLNLRF